MNKTLILTLAATIVGGSFSINTAAHAGNGVRLHFNGPLGSFVATPSRGAKASGYAAGGYGASQKCKKDMPSYASRRAPAEKPSYAQAQSTKRVKKETTVAAYHKPKSRSINRAENNDTDSAENTTETNGPSGSTALIQAQTQQDAAQAPEAFGPPAPPAEELTTAAVEETKPAVTEESKTSEEPASKDGEGCKKFIPAVGVTVSVGC